jgi:hypothetical protein
MSMKAFASFFVSAALSRIAVFGAATLRLPCLLAHLAQRLGEVGGVAVEHPLDFLRRVHGGGGEPRHLAQLLLDRRQIGHRKISLGRM